MGNERNWDDLRKIIIPPQELGRHPSGEGLAKDVVPADDAWLVSEGRSIEEVNKVLEGRLSGVEISLAAEDENPLRNTYGIKKELSLPQIRLIAYMELVRQAREAKKRFDKQIDDLRKNYEAEKEQIEQKYRSKNRAGEEKSKRFATKYKPEIETLQERGDIQRRVGDMILRKAVMEIFSPNGDAVIRISSMPTVMEEINKTTTAGDMMSEFVGDLANYLQRTRDQQLFMSYKYRNSPEIITSTADTKVLAANLRYVLDPEGTESDERTMNILQKLGRAYLVFLGNRARGVSRLNSEAYPRLSLLYDTLTAAFSSQRIRVMESVGSQVVDGVMENLFTGREFDNEVKRYSQLYMDGIRPLYGWSKGISQAEISGWAEALGANALLPGELPQIFVDTATKPEIRIMNGMQAMITNSRMVPDENVILGSPREVVRVFVKISESIKRGLGLDQGIREKDNFVLNLPLNMPLRQIYSQTGINEDLWLYLEEVQRKWGPRGKHDTRKDGDNDRSSYKAIAELIIRHPGEEYGKLWGHRLLGNYIDEYWNMNRNQTERLERQNAFLLHEVLNNSKWFVSPRGDRFSQERDSELADKQIESVQFGVDRKYPREHKVDITLTQGVPPYKMWLDIEGNLLDEERRHLALDPTQNQILLNIVLRRLFVISSGVLSDESETEGGGYAIKDPLGWRRAHYRIYPPGSKFTLGSQGAKEHAVQIQEDYGINIWKEIERRIKIGTLLPSQVMTFVREVSPKDLLGQEVTLPNELPFDTDWVPQTS